MDQGAIPLVRTEHHHIGKRSAHLQLLAPSKDITLDWHFPDGKIRSFQYTHGDTSYVNLEPLQSHGLLLSRRQICVERGDSRSALNLDFRHNDVYQAAKEEWHNPGLLFVLEDESCHEGRNIRSVYRSLDTIFDDANLSMEIAADDLSFGPYEAEAAHSVTILTGSLASLKQRHPDSRFYLTQRLNAGISERLSKREDPLSETKETLEDGDELPEKIENPIDPDDLDADKIIDEVKNLTMDGLGKVLDGLEKIGFSFTIPMPIDFEGNLNQTTHPGREMTYGSDENRKPITTTHGHGEPWPNITLVDSYAKVHLEVRAVISFNIKGATDLLQDGGEDGFDSSMTNMFGENSMADFYVEVEAMEDLAIRLQAELAGTVGFLGFCIVFLYPYGTFGCSAGPLIDDDALQWDVPRIPTGPDIKTKFSNLGGVNGFGA
ncbi:hypothetical protein PMIN07_000620 [Paraphaeosphaeria minitans]